MSALKDLLVIDASAGKPGAVAAMLLADNGARVVRLDNSRKFSDPDPVYSIYDRGKEFVDISIEETERFNFLLSKADVLIEDFGQFHDIDSGNRFSELSGMNPGLIHCSISAYGTKGDLRGKDQDADLIKARLGMYDATPGFRDGHIYIVHPLVEIGTGILAAQGVAAGLYSRLMTGSGRAVETSMVSGAMLFTPLARGDEVTTIPMEQTPFGGAPFYSVHECSDGKWLQLGCIHLGFIDQASAVLGLSEVLLDPKYGDGRRPEDNEARQELFDLVRSVMKTDTAENWSAKFEAADVPHALVHTAVEIMEHPQIIHNKSIHSLVDPVFGSMDQPGLTLKLSETQGSIRSPRKKIKWEELKSQLKEIPAKDYKLIDGNDLPLDGIRVADITNVIAGPASGRHLADLGAEVYKIESLSGDLSRGSHPIFHSLNSNKRSISINAKDEIGRSVIKTIVSQCDALVANLRPGAIERMGLGGTELRKLNPKLVDTHVTAFGWDGPLSQMPGVDPLAQAYMGLQDAQGGVGNRPSYLSALAPCDFSGGALAAFGTVMGLYVAEISGKGQKIDTNLLNMGTLMLGDDFTRYADKPVRRLADPDQYGLSDFRRLYRTSNGWIFLNAEEDEAYLEVLKTFRIDAMPFKERFEHTQIGKTLEKMFLAYTSSDAVRLMSFRDIPSIESFEDFSGKVFDDSQILANSMVAKLEFDSGSQIELLQRFVNFPGTVYPVRYPTPRLGQHNLEILREFTVSDGDIEAMILSGAIEI